MPVKTGGLSYFSDFFLNRPHEAGCIDSARSRSTQASGYSLTKVSQCSSPRKSWKIDTSTDPDAQIAHAFGALADTKQVFSCGSKAASTACIASCSNPSSTRAQQKITIRT